MEVTRENFEVVLPKMLSILEQAEFYSVDFEMTGIRINGKEGKITDPAHVAFEEKNEAAQKYNLVQFGVCFFVKVSTSGIPRYEAYPFNLYVFPGNKNSDLTLNVDTLGFLSKHGMDFTKWITQGVSYLPAQLAAAKRASLAGGADGAGAPRKWDQSLLAKVEKGDAATFTDFMAQAQTFAEASQAAELSDGAVPVPASPRYPYFKSRDTLMVCDQYVASLGLTKRTERGPKGNITFLVSASSGAKDEERRVEESIGATRLVEALIASKKPIVAHNSLSDFLFMHYAFDGRDVADLAQFKQILREKHPIVFDTRHLATSQDVPYDAKMVQNLEGQYLAFQEQHGNAFFVDLPLGFEAYDPQVLQSSSRAHEAAYDALITGKLLLYLARQLGDGTLPSIAQKYGNRIPVYRCLETVILDQPTDGILHDGPVIVMKYPPNAMNSSKIDSLLTGNELRGRVLWNFDCAFIFSPASSRGTLFDKSVETARRQLKSAVPRGTVEVVRP